MPKDVTKQGEAATAHGEKLPTPIPFSFTFSELQKGDEIPANEMPDDEDLRGFVNTKRSAKARSIAQAAAFEEAGIKKPDLKEDKEARIKAIARTLVLGGETQENAEKLARSVVG